MNSYTLVNGQQHHVGPFLQPSQAASYPSYDATRNQQAGTANTSCQYRTVNFQTIQGTNFIVHNGAFSNRQMSNLQTSAPPNQVVSSQQTAGGPTSSGQLLMLLANAHNTPTNMQRGNPCLPAPCVFQVATMHSAAQGPSNQIEVNPTYPQQNMSNMANCQQSAVVNERQTVRTQDDSSVQQGRLLKCFLQNANETPITAYTTTATSSPQQQALSTITLLSGSALNRQTAQNQIQRQNIPQQGFGSSAPPPSYQMAIRNNNNNTETHTSTSAQNIQQYRAQLSSIINNRQDVTNPRNVNSRKQSKTRSFFARTNECPIKPAVLQLQMHSPNVTVDNRQNMQPVISSVSGNYNLNATQFFPLHSAQPLSTSTQSVMPKTQHILNVPLQQNSVPNVLFPTPTEDGRVRNTTDNTIVTNDNTVSNGSQGGMSSDVDRLMQSTETISPQRNNPQLSPPNFSEMLSSGRQHDSSIHLSPGHTGPRAVAVVQPLYQECCQVATEHTLYNTTRSDSLSNLEKVFISPAGVKSSKVEILREESNLNPDNPNAMEPNTSVVWSSAASNDGSVLSSLNSESQNLSQKPGLDINTASTAQISEPSEISERQNIPKDQSEMETPPAAPFYELSSLPTTEWTLDALKGLIKNAEAQVKQDDCPEFESGQKLLNMHWNGKLPNLTCYVNSGWYTDLIRDVANFTSTPATPDSVVLTQVKPSSVDQLQNFHVFKKDNEVHSERPYKSSWLNVNEQLDDLDKEFGSTLTWKRHLHLAESDSQRGDVRTVTTIPPPIVNEVSNNVMSETELKPFDSGEEKKGSTVEAPSIQPASPNKINSENSSDPFYSFKIQVLPPEDAQRIFQQVQSKMPQGMAKESQEEEVMSSSVENKIPEEIDATLSESEVLNRAFDPIEQVCCKERWLELKFGSSTPFLRKCQCNVEQSQKQCTDKTLDEEEMAAQKDDNLCEISFESKFHPSMEGENPARSKKKQVPNLMQDLSIKMSEPEDKCAQEPLKSKGNIQFSALVRSDKEKINTALQSEAAIEMSDQKEGCGHAQLKSADGAESLLETKRQSQTSFSRCVTPDTVERKRKRLSCHNEDFPFLKESQKCKPSVDLDSQQILEGDSKCETVQLVLFGSVQKDECGLISERISHISSLRGASDAAQRPPKVLSVILTKRRSSEAAHRSKYSIKQLLYEKWRRSLPSAKIKVLNKLKRQKRQCSSLSGLSFKKEELPLPYERRVFDKNTKHYQILKKRQSNFNELKPEEEKTEKEVKQPVDHEGSNTENKSHDVKPLQENNVLRFSVLPNTFNFQDGSKDGEETTDPVSEEPNPTEEKDNSNTDVQKVQGSWCLAPERRNSPLQSHGFWLFQEFKKKYKEYLNTKSPTDK